MISSSNFHADPISTARGNQPIFQGNKQNRLSRLTNSLLFPLRHWLDSIAVQDIYLAKLICRLIPPTCPFERDIKVFGRTVLHIPPLCHFNPIYDELVGLRFRALIFLDTLNQREFDGIV